jgi:hypothetical protein
MGLFMEAFLERRLSLTVIGCMFIRFTDLTHNVLNRFFFFGKLTYVLKEEDTNIIRGIPQIYNDNRNIKQQMAIG